MPHWSLLTRARNFAAELVGYACCGHGVLGLFGVPQLVVAGVGTSGGLVEASRAWGRSPTARLVVPPAQIAVLKLGDVELGR